MSYNDTANKLIESVNTRRLEIGMKDDEHGNLVVVATSRQFNDWILSDYDNSAHIALSTRCPVFQHIFVNELPNNPDITIVEVDDFEVGFIVNRLNDVAQQTK